MDRPTVAVLGAGSMGEIFAQGLLRAGWETSEIILVTRRPERVRDLALFNLAIDSKLRACDLVRLRVSDISHGNRVSRRAIVMQRKTRRPVQFEITDQSQFAIRT